MATGILGQSNPSALTNTTVYTVPVGKTATFNISISNTTGYIAGIRLAISSSGTPTSAEFIEYDTLVDAYNVIERTGIVAQAGENVVIYSSIAGISVSVYGYEE